MKCTFIIEQLWVDGVGPEYLISMLRNHGYQTDVVFDNSYYRPWVRKKDYNSIDRDYVSSLINGQKTDIVFMSITTDSYQRSLHIIKI